MHPRRSRTRRLLTAALAAVLVTGGLAACRTDDNVAAYVDDAEITEAEVEEVVSALEDTLRTNVDQQLEEIRASLDDRVGRDDEFDQADADAEYASEEATREEGLTDQLDQQRERIVEMLVLTEVATAYAEDEGIEVADPRPAQHAEQTGLPADHPYVDVVAEFFAVMSPLQGTVEPTAPSEADQREVYDDLVDQGATQVEFAEAREVLTEQRLGESVAIRDLFEEMLSRVDVELNPRYDGVYEVPVQLGQGQGQAGSGPAASLRVDLEDSAVVDE